jgi:hypothetical protein
MENKNITKFGLRFHQNKGLTDVPDKNLLCSKQTNSIDFYSGHNLFNYCLFETYCAIEK